MTTLKDSITSVDILGIGKDLGKTEKRLDNSFIRSFVRSFVRSFFHFFHSFYSFYSFIHSFVQFIHSFIHFNLFDLKVVITSKKSGYLIMHLTCVILENLQKIHRLVLKREKCIATGLALMVCIHICFYRKLIRGGMHF